MDLIAIIDGIDANLEGVKRNNKDIELEKQAYARTSNLTDATGLEKAIQNQGRYKHLTERKNQRLNKIYTAFVGIMDVLGLDPDKKFEVEDLTEAELSTLKKVTPAAMKKLCEIKLKAYQASSKESVSKAFSPDQWDFVTSLKKEMETLAGKGFEFKLINTKPVKISRISNIK